MIQLICTRHITALTPQQVFHDFESKIVRARPSLEGTVGPARAFLRLAMILQWLAGRLQSRRPWRILGGGKFRVRLMFLFLVTGSFFHVHRTSGVLLRRTRQSWKVGPTTVCGNSTSSTLGGSRTRSSNIQLCGFWWQA